MKVSFFCKQMLCVCLKVKIIATEMLNELAALLGDVNGVEVRDRSHLCYKSIINYDLDIMNFLVVSPHFRYGEVFDIMNPRFND